jgi:5-methylcytosine-specific restriction endonuclease McrA
MRNAGKWTEARFWSFVRSALRGAFQRWPPKHAAKEAAKITVEGKAHKFEYRCASCNDTFRAGEVQVDHIVPAGSLKCYDDLPAFVEKLFCEQDGFQTLCKPCHQNKTNSERGEHEPKKGV